MTIEKDSSSGSYQISGVLGPNEILKPVKGKAGSPKDCPRCKSLTPHVVMHQHNNNSDTSDYQQVEADYSQARQGKSLPGKVHPELLVVVDFDFSKNFDFDIKSIKKYVISYFNAVNMRFKSFSAPRIELSIAGLVIAKTKSSLPFISQSIYKSDMLNSIEALNAMGKYYYKDRFVIVKSSLPFIIYGYSFRPELPIYDMVVTLTGLDMSRMKGGKMSRSNSGYAYVGGACVRNVYLKKISSVALVEDSGGYSGVVVTAHEIGHLLGAVHDGDASPSYLRGPGAKSCPWNMGFIMSDLRRTSRGQLWSDCSVKQIRYFLKTTTAGCLHNVPRHQDYSLPGSSYLPGRQLSLDAQCFADRGTRACYKDQRVCSQLFCYNKDNGGCYAYRPAVEGSSCGNGKMCRSGKCITSGKTSSYEDVKRKPKIYSTPKTKPPKKVTRPSKKPKKTTTKQKSKPKWNNRKSKWSSKSSRIKNKKQKTTSRKSKSREGSTERKAATADTTIKGKEEENDKCEDSFSLQGSLNCEQLFKRYAFHYCERNKVIKKRCCKSYITYCTN